MPMGPTGRWECNCAEPFYWHAHIVARIGPFAFTSPGRWCEGCDDLIDDATGLRSLLWRLVLDRFWSGETHVTKERAA